MKQPQVTIGPGVFFGAGIKISNAQAEAFDYRRTRIKWLLWNGVITFLVPMIINAGFATFDLESNWANTVLSVIAGMGALLLFIPALLMVKGPQIDKGYTVEPSGNKFVAKYSYWGMFSRITRERVFDTQEDAKAFFEV